ncbi:inositol monophosphatase family protein [Demetria terragena]|uniref:inositol monophosphatase family protein n=1 Tax=Demetria terragena TaxID=63959 RepID=UPI0003A7F3B7|nr:inositol monophosphatase family protein [Demetria terragena]
MGLSNGNLTEDEVRGLERLACDIAREAGRLVIDKRPHDLGVAATKSSVVDVVTVMDQRSEELLRDRLARERPDDAILGEEGDDVAGSSGITWVLDPIDGTVNYLYDIPAFAVSVAACVGDVGVPGGWEPVAAVVYDPRAEMAYHARQGGGAYALAADGTSVPLQVSVQSDLAMALVATGFGYDAQVRARQGEVLAGLLPHIRDIRRFGACSLDLVAVAAGRVDVYYESGPKVWDMAAGALILTEAGGVLQGSAGGPADETLMVAGPSSLVEALRPRVDRGGVS